mgnify:CR=1 FL=1
MFISTIIPVFNDEKTVKQAIQSVIDQTEPPNEIIIIDDGSTDSSAKIVKSIKSSVPIRYFFQKNQLHT